MDLIVDVFKTDIFDKWLKKIKDKRAKAIIQVHINRLIENKLGKVKPLGNTIYEKKIDYGPGYRLYFVKSDKLSIILLCGGDKSTQQNNIKQARVIAKAVNRRMKGEK